MGKFQHLLSIAALIAVANAHCPNSCSGRGECGQYDMCTCFTDYTGGDCSERTCPFEKAWVTTNANGDINHNDVRYDGVTYVADHDLRSSGLDYVIDQNNPHGTFESWPHTLSKGATAKDEGHFYMECANRGTCDRSSGECQCFSGFTGAACERTTCPNSCSGHGVCKTVALQNDGNDYTLWDAEMSRSCVCDAGYEGIDCGLRKCPLGDDPLTTSQTTETQYVDIFVGSTGTGALTAGVAALTLGGSFKLKYTDYNGKEWTTSSITVTNPTSSSNADTLSAAVEAALLALPNDVIRNVDVSVGYIDKVIAGNFKSSSNAIATATNGAGNSASYADGKILRCESAVGEEYLYGETSSGVLKPYDSAAGTFTGTTITLTDGDDFTCFELQYYWGIRLKINFVDTPGDLTSLSADITDVTAGGLTNSQRGSAYVETAVTSTPSLAMEDAQGITTSYTAPGATLDTGVALSSKAFTSADGTKYFPGQKVKVTCITTSKVMGTFTVTSSASNVVTFTESIADCASISTVQTNHVIIVNADLTGRLGAGQRLSIQGSSASTPTITGVTYDATTGTGYIFLSASYGSTASTAATNYVHLDGDGSSEKAVCSSRGLCDTETGLCSCFRGYTGFACQLQNALSN